MAIKVYNPTTPAQRGMTTQDMSEITTKKPLGSLTVSMNYKAARNNQGRITTRHRGGQVKRFYRLVNFALPVDTTAVVEQIEYDPNRSARIARIFDQNSKHHYIIAPDGVKVGQTIVSGDRAPIETGNRLPLKNIPIGSTIFGIELTPGRGAQLVRSAGNNAQLMAREGDYAQVRLPSGEVRLIHVNCMAHIGSVGNLQHQNIKYGKAGRMRKKGIRPGVRGVVMNPVDHPHGGGEARGKGYKSPMTPWGQKTLGFKTRTRKSTTKYIVRTRHEGKRK